MNNSQDKQVANPSRKQVGYFCHLAINEKHMGGILITNQIGVPLEFKYTEPVTATKLNTLWLCIGEISARNSYSGSLGEGGAHLAQLLHHDL